MMNDPLSSTLIDESIRLERNVAALYLVFSETVPEDAEFWVQLHREEENHARLIQDARDAFAKRGKFPQELMAGSVEELIAANEQVVTLAEQYREKPPTRREACEAALRIENESGENHYTHFVEQKAESSVQALFQQLNRQDKDHERRILERLQALPDA